VIQNPEGVRTMAQCNATAELEIHLRSNLKVRNLLIATHV